MGSGDGDLIENLYFSYFCYEAALHKNLEFHNETKHQLFLQKFRFSEELLFPGK